MSLNLFDKPYEEGTPNWDIGRPQHEIVRLHEQNLIIGTVLDLGCGTGENALYLSERGYEVWGMDASAEAIVRAKRKVEQRGVKIDQGAHKPTFLLGNALRLDLLDRSFETAIDSGLFHGFTDEERPVFVKSLQKALKPGSTYYLLCFSDLEPKEWGGPRRISQRDIRRSFGEGWKVNWIRPAGFETNIHQGGGGKAWLASITKPLAAV